MVIISFTKFQKNMKINQLLFKVFICRLNACFALQICFFFISLPASVRITDLKEEELFLLFAGIQVIL